MLKRFARNPSTASLTPAITKIANAISISLEAIAQMMTGTRIMRASVMIFGILNSVVSRLPARFLIVIPFLRGGPAVVYIVSACHHCTKAKSDVTSPPTAGAGRKFALTVFGTGHERAQKRAHLRGFRRRYRRG